MRSLPCDRARPTEGSTCGFDLVGDGRRMTVSATVWPGSAVSDRSSINGGRHHRLRRHLTRRADTLHDQQLGTSHRGLAVPRTEMLIMGRFGSRVRPSATSTPPTPSFPGRHRRSGLHRGWRRRGGTVAATLATTCTGPISRTPMRSTLAVADHQHMSSGGERLRWHELPPDVRRGIEAVLGAPVAVERSQPGGFSPGLASRLGLAGAWTEHPRRRSRDTAVGASRPVGSSELIGVNQLL